MSESEQPRGGRGRLGVAHLRGDVGQRGAPWVSSSRRESKVLPERDERIAEARRRSEAVCRHERKHANLIGDRERSRPLIAERPCI